MTSRTSPQTEAAAQPLGRRIVWLRQAAVLAIFWQVCGLLTPERASALGEAIAHVHLLMHRKRIDREMGEDGVYRFRSIAPDLERRAHPDAHDAPSDGPVMV